jgi:hypothetical protein
MSILQNAVPQRIFSPVKMSTFYLGVLGLKTLHYADVPTESRQDIFILLGTFPFEIIGCILSARDTQMLHELRSNVVLEPRATAKPKVFENWHTVQQFRFLPESYLAAVGAEWDPGLDQLVYLRMFIEDETEDAFQ